MIRVNQRAMRTRLAPLIVTVKQEPQDDAALLLVPHNGKDDDLINNNNNNINHRNMETMLEDHNNNNNIQHNLSLLRGFATAAAATGACDRNNNNALELDKNQSQQVFLNGSSELGGGLVGVTSIQNQINNNLTWLNGLKSEVHIKVEEQDQRAAVELHFESDNSYRAATATTTRAITATGKSMYPSFSH